MSDELYYDMRSHVYYDINMLTMKRYDMQIKSFRIHNP